MTKLNGKQRFLITNCLKELEKETNPKMYEAKIKVEKRKKNNQCAAKFRRKRKQYEIKNEVATDHLKELVQDIVKRVPQNLGNLKMDFVENKLKYVLSLLESHMKNRKKDIIVEKVIKPTQQQSQQLIIILMIYRTRSIRF